MNYYGGYQQPYQPQPYQQQQQQRLPPTTNKVYVVSLEDALSRFSTPNTVMIYILQDDSAVFEIFTDEQGRKAYKAKKLVDIQEQPNGGGDLVTRQEFEELKKAIEAMKGVDE